MPQALPPLLLVPFLISYLTPHLPSFIVHSFQLSFSFQLITTLVEACCFSFNRLMETYGFFDANVKRDVIPDARLNKTMLGVVVFTVMRPVVGPLVLWNDWKLKGGASEWDVTQ